MTFATPEFLALQSALAGEYSLQRELGRGGMGVVYLARDVQLDRPVAIKVLPEHLAARADDRERFLREARTAAGLSHPHIVPIHRVGEAGGFVFFVMAYVAGETLGERLRAKGPLPAREAMRIMREVAWALAHAHARGIVHRDVKPDNILIEEGTGRALVTDFGIAHRHDAGTITDPGQVRGTAHFMSPEQAAGAPLDGRSDLYALGVVGFLATSGRLPFEAPSLPALMVKQAVEPAPSLLRVAPGVPAVLSRVIDRCLSIDAAERFAGGEELAAALAPVSEGTPALPAPLRRWLSSGTQAQWIYNTWFAITGFGTALTAMEGLLPGQHFMLANLPGDMLLVAAPLVPMAITNIASGRRLFRAGYTLADLRAALEQAARERRVADQLDDAVPLTLAQRLLRGLGWSSAATAFVVSSTSSLLFSPALHRTAWVITPLRYQQLVLASWVVAGLFFVAMNVVEVPVLPAKVRRLMGSGLRERLWSTRAGAWLARRLNAPAGAGKVSPASFRQTEAALGAAAGDLFAALPREFRDQLRELPDVVRALEARAAEARGEVERLNGLADDGSLAARGDHARRHLATAVAALEGIRLDLLRLHAGAADLAPLTTLLDAARMLGEDASRLADAQRDVERIMPRSLPGVRPFPTPA